jgi:hypothetical protein
MFALWCFNVRTWIDIRVNNSVLHVWLRDFVALQNTRNCHRTVEIDHASFVGHFAVSNCIDSKLISILESIVVCCLPSSSFQELMACKVGLSQIEILPP